LLNWKAAVMEKSPNSVIEFEVHKVGGKHRKIGHGSWSTLGGLLEIILSWLSQVMLTRG
jgi:hypothetical protein